MHRVHSGFTLADAVKSGETKQLRAKLKKMSMVKDMKISLSPFAKSETTLYVSGVILPAEYYYGETLPETLVFATTYYGTLSNHLSDIVSACKNELCEILQHCVHFPFGRFISEDNIIYYLKKHSHHSAFNSRYNCITKQDVEGEKNLRNEIEKYIDRAQDLNAINQHLAPLQVKTLIQRHIVTCGDEYEWSHKPDRRSAVEFLILNQGPIAQKLSVLLILLLWNRYWKYILGSAFIAGVAGVSTVFYITRQTYQAAVRPDDDYVRQIAATQLHPVINEMTAAGPLKKGRLRRFFYAAALRVVGFLARHLINVPTVSNIRWLVINDRKRLVFMPNYANATDFYVREFLTGSTPNGVNFMFTNGQSFPDARWLHKGGITENPEGYMNAVHTGQHITDLWYAHEPHLTADIINKNHEIRNGLFKSMNEEEAKDWLKLL